MNDFYQTLAELRMLEFALINRRNYDDDQFDLVLKACTQLDREGVIRIDFMHRESYTGHRKVQAIQVTRISKLHRT